VTHSSGAMFPWSKPPPPPPPPESLLEFTLGAIPWHIVGVIVGTHFALTAFFFLFVGWRRNTAAVMGGADSDNKKADAKTKRGSLLATVLAYNVLAVAYATFSSYTGTTAWFDGSAAALSGSLHDRLYGYSEAYALMGAVTIAYELYNTIAALCIHEYCNAAFVGHHATCFVLGIMSLHPYCHYYAIFFFGLTSISSVPLAIIELFNCAGMPAVQEVFRVLFCVLFLIYRTVYWPIVSYGFWLDEIAALQGVVPVHSLPAHLFLLVANVGLTALQFFWTSLIFSGIAEKFRPAESPKAE